MRNNGSQCTINTQQKIYKIVYSKNYHAIDNTMKLDKIRARKNYINIAMPRQMKKYNPHLHTRAIPFFPSYAPELITTA